MHIWGCGTKQRSFTADTNMPLLARVHAHVGTSQGGDPQGYGHCYCDGPKGGSRGIEVGST